MPPPLQEDGEGGGLGGGCEDGGGGDDRDGGGLEEEEEDDGSCQSDGGVDLEPSESELGVGGGLLGQPFLGLGGELELDEPRGAGAVELLPPPFPPLDGDELGDGAMSDMLFFVDMLPLLLVHDPSWWYYVALPPET